MRLVVVIELDLGILIYYQRNIRSTGSGILAVILVPGPVQSGLITWALLILIITRRDLEGALPYVILGIVSQEGFLTGKHPVCLTAQLRLQRAGDRDRFGLGRVCSRRNSSQKTWEGQWG